MHRLFRYPVDIGVPVTFAALPQPVISANGVKGLFEAVRDQELKVTHHVGLVFVDEQHEENAQCRKEAAAV
jgi:ferritin